MAGDSSRGKREYAGIATRRRLLKGTALGEIQGFHQSCYVTGVFETGPRKLGRRAR